MTTWHATLTINTPPDTDPETLGETLLTGFPHDTFPSLTHRTDTNRAVLQVNLNAATLADATTTAINLITKATATLEPPPPIAGLTIRPLAEHLADPGLELVGSIEAAAILGVTRQRVGQLAGPDGNPAFPTPLARLKSGPVWDAGAIRRFNQTWARRTGRAPKTAA